jgi:hypothetical protein
MTPILRGEALGTQERHVKARAAEPDAPGPAAAPPVCAVRKARASQYKLQAGTS